MGQHYKIVNVDKKGGFMGQYYKIVNVDKKEAITPHLFNNGAKLMEFGNSSSGVLCGLAILLANSNGRGGGDLCSEDKIVGSWAGDRIVICGDYAEKDDPAEDLDTLFEGGEYHNLYHKSENYKDISVDVICAMLDDNYILELYRKDYNDSIFLIKDVVDNNEKIKAKINNGCKV